MTKKNKGLIFSLFAFLLTLVGGFVFGGCSVETKTSISYANNLQDFDLKFQTQKVVYVDDLDFGTDTMLNVNRSIKFVGKKEKSTFSKVFINILAPNVGGERIKVEFENIIFDGGFDKTGIDLTQDDTFSDILGDRDNKHCITACEGHYDLTIENCEFTNYASEYGSVIFVNNDSESPDDKVITLNNSKFYNNICERGTVDIFHDKSNVKITNCEFYGNYGATGTGFNVGNGKLYVDNCVVKDNNFCKFAIEDVSGQNAGGGVSIGAFDGKISNTKIIHNESVFGGGLAVVSSHVGDNRMILENCIIKDNTATKNGGGIMLSSKQGQTISFIGCEISFNKAPSSATICSIPMAGWNPNNKSGNINFLFCKIAMNEGMDNKGIITDLDFYGLTNNQKQKANTQIKGCIIIDDTALTANEGDYNYIATQNQAELDGVIDYAQISNSSDKNLCFLNNNKTNIVVPAKVYSMWHMEFDGATKGSMIGNYVRQIDENTNKTLVEWLSFVGSLIIMIGASLLTCKLSEKSKQIATPIKVANVVSNDFINTTPIQLNNVANNSQPLNRNQENKESFSNISFSQLEIEQIMANWELINALSKKEKEVFALRLSGKKRKEIAKSQFVSENTIKKQLIKIYVKLEVANGKELLETAKKYLNN